MTASHRDGAAVAAAGDRATAAAASGPVLTAAAARMLAAEVERLRALKEREFTERRREAIAVSASDEDAQLAIGEDEVVVNARIANLESLLRRAQVIDHEPEGPDVVTIGSRVTVEDVATGRSSTYAMVAWHDSATPSAVSAASPVGQAVLGRAAGEEVTIALPDRRTRKLRIASVEQPTETLS